MIYHLFNVILIIIYLLLVKRVYKQNKQFFILLILFLINHIWTIISVAYIETGIYLSDTYIQAGYTGSTIRLIIYEIIFMISILIGLRYKKTLENKNFSTSKIIKNKNFSIAAVCLLIITLINIILITNVVISGNVISNSSITRFNYYTDYSRIPIANQLRNIIFPLQLMNGILFLNFKKKWLKCLTIFNALASIGYLYLIGNEAMELVYVIVMFITPYLVNIIPNLSNKNIQNKVKRRKNKKRIIFALIIVVSFCIFALYNKYMYFTEHNPYSAIVETPFEGLLYRALALQGNTWWTTDYDVLSNGLFEPKQIFNELSIVVDENQRYNTGIWFLMKNIMPSKYFSIMVEGNATLNAGYPAINIAMFGYVLSTVIVVIEGIIYFCMTYYLYNKIRYDQFIKAFFATIVWFQMYRVYTMGGIGYLFNFLPLLSIFVLILSEFFFRNKRIQI